MKALLIFVFVVCAGFIPAKMMAQKTPANTFVVTAKAGTPEAIQASNAVQNADFSEFRLRSTRRKLTFDNGVIIELLSAEEMKALGYDINPQYYPETLPAGYKEPVYTVNFAGQLIVSYSSGPHKN